MDIVKVQYIAPENMTDVYYIHQDALSLLEPIQFNLELQRSGESLPSLNLLLLSQN